jgi:hypothetical protein
VSPVGEPQGLFLHAPVSSPRVPHRGPIAEGRGCADVCGETLNNLGGAYMNDFMAREFWRFVQVQQYVGKLAETAIEFPPIQAPATFNLQAVKAKIDEAMRNHAGQ